MKLLTKFPVYLTIAFFALISFMGLSEWWNIQISNNAHLYAWGEANNNPWFYKTPTLYANVMLFEGLIMLALTIGLSQQNKQFRYWLLACFVFLILIYASAQY